MGEEIKYSHFRQNDYANFQKHLEEETELLGGWFADGQLSSKSPIAGYELEAWLIDPDCTPCPHNEPFLKTADNELLSPELAKFNIELNVPPQPLTGSVLDDFDTSLCELWAQCGQLASGLDCNILGIGILPTLEDSHLTLDNMSTLDRYRALNEHVMRLRQGQSIPLNIVGNEHLQTEHRDVMLEAAATSLQIHIQVPQAQAVRYYNASILLSAAMVGVSTNAPYLFGKQLWEETRIPVFEQSVPTGGFDGASNGPVHRVSFGMGYARESVFECFSENLEHFPVMLPVDYHEDIETLRHLRLHNGTIWRWNRPLIGFDEDGTPHLRIEQRVCSSGPTMEDNIANIAFFYGLVHYYAVLTDPAEAEISFAESKDNFYHAAQHGTHTHIRWLDNQRVKLQRLILDRLLVESETGLLKLGIDENDIKHYLGIIEQRIHSAQTGSQWQRQFVESQGCDMRKLTQTYLRNQRTNTPVHNWDFSSND